MVEVDSLATDQVESLGTGDVSEDGKLCIVYREYFNTGATNSHLLINELLIVVNG